MSAMAPMILASCSTGCATLVPARRFGSRGLPQYEASCLKYLQKRRMSLQVSAAQPDDINASSSQSSHINEQENRRSAGFLPSFWGDYFLSYDSTTTMETKERKEHQELKEEVKNLLRHTAANRREMLREFELIDAIQRLGVSYHFEGEIDGMLKQLNVGEAEEIDDEDLHMVALRFRLLRQQGIRASCDVFRNFKDEEGKFKESLTSNIQGMLSLYEATYLRIHGEDILEEALTFTTHHLAESMGSLDSFTSKLYNLSIKQPIWKGLKRMYARSYIPIYEQDASHNEILLHFAKLDFNILQRLYQKELSYIMRWWKDVGIAKELPFARDRVVECFFWALGVYCEPEHVIPRRSFTKVAALTTIIDDIFDAHGTFQELQIFTDSIEKWDLSAMEQLPEYMKVCYRAVIDVYAEIGEELAAEGKSCRFLYAVDAMKMQVRSYFAEVKWLHFRHEPSFEEYMSVASTTAGVFMLTTVSLVSMPGDLVTKDTLEWLFNRPKILAASEAVLRLMNDVGSQKFEQEREHIPSAVQCYMRQYGATKREAVEELQRQVSAAWEDINGEWLSWTRSVPLRVLASCLNHARFADFTYEDEVDKYTNGPVALKDDVASLFVYPVE